MLKSMKSHKALSIACGLVAASFNYSMVAEAQERAVQTHTAQPVTNVVLVHGAWADGSSWSKIIPLLEAKGLHVVAVQNPLTSVADT